MNTGEFSVKEHGLPLLNATGGRASRLALLLDIASHVQAGLPVKEQRLFCSWLCLCLGLHCPTLPYLKVSEGRKTRAEYKINITWVWHTRKVSPFLNIAHETGRSVSSSFLPGSYKFLNKRYLYIVLLNDANT